MVDRCGQRKATNRVIGESNHPHAILSSLYAILLITSCAPSNRLNTSNYPVAPSGPISPLAVVRDSDDHSGRVLRGNLARIYLANGLQVIAPPEKDLVALYGDVNSCRYGGNDSSVELYVTCLHDRGDTLQSPHGIVLRGANEDTRPNLTSQQEREMWERVLCPICALTK